MNALIPLVDHYDPHAVPIAALHPQPPLPGLEEVSGGPYPRRAVTWAETTLSPEAVAALLDAADNRRAE